MQQSLPEKTRAVLNKIAAMECIKPYILVGGCGRRWSKIVFLCNTTKSTQFIYYSF
jgi:hypothetical protein